MRILIIEDDERISGFMKRGLEAEAHDVRVALDGERGIDLIQTASFDLIILDVYLPQKNGLEICRYLRNQRIMTPILMMTAKDFSDLKEEGMRAGANDYLTKPFPFEVLLKKIDKLVCH